MLAHPFARDLVSEGYAQQAMFALEAGASAAAIPSALRSMALRIEDRRQAYLVGQAYRGMGKLDEAAVAFAEDVRENPWYASAWHDLGAVELARGRRTAALLAFRRAIDLNPRDAEARRQAGVLDAGRPGGPIDRPEKR